MTTKHTSGRSRISRGGHQPIIWLIFPLKMHEIEQNWTKTVHVACYYRSGTVNSNTVNSKFHLIRSYCEIFVYNCPNISCLKCTVNSNFHLIRSKTLPTNDFELTVPDLYVDPPLHILRLEIELFLLTRLSME